MIHRLAVFLRRFGIDTRSLYQTLARLSIDAAAREQGLAPLADKLRAVVPDISDQFTATFAEAEYGRFAEPKMRALHALQMRCLLDAIDHIEGDGLVLADIGDSSGNHAAYVRALAPSGAVARIVSVNLDPVAVDKIRAGGGEAILSRAEDLDAGGLGPRPGVPVRGPGAPDRPPAAPHRLAAGQRPGHVVATVPYRRHSRFGGHHMRLPPSEMPERLTAEQVHLYEFSPEDWHVLFRFAGYNPVFSRLYLQYPKRSLLRLAAPLWRRVNFEGFLGVLLAPDDAVSRRYADW